MKIIFLGNLVLDSIFYLDQSLNANKSNQANEFKYNIGGVGNNLKFLKIYKNVFIWIHKLEVIFLVYILLKI